LAEWFKAVSLKLIRFNRSHPFKSDILCTNFFFFFFYFGLWPAWQASLPVKLAGWLGRQAIYNLSLKKKEKNWKKKKNTG
jgi:hypothetical protein